MKTKIPTPYVSITAWIHSIWDAINELRSEIGRLHDEDTGLYTRVERIEEAIGKGIYEEYEDGPTEDTVPCGEGNLEN